MSQKPKKKGKKIIQEAGEGIPLGVCQAAKGGKETEDGCGGYVVGGGGVGNRRQGQWSVRESEGGSVGE